MDRPHLRVPRYVALRTDRKLSDEDVKEWFKTVKREAPSGVLLGLQAVSKGGKPKTASIVHREGKDGHEYIIPLTRDLTQAECEPIVTAWMTTHPDGDMDIEISSEQAAKLERSAPSVKVPGDAYLSMCMQLAKAQHNRWVDEKVEQGWRYGPTLSLKKKTHPLLRPWDDLPAKYRKLDTDAPQRFMDLLNSQGYTVVRKDEIEALARLMRNIH